MSCYNVYQIFKTSGWRREIELFEKSYTGESQLRCLYEDVKPKKGDIMVTIETSTKHNNPWISGSFYLFTAVVILAILAAICKMLNIWVLPVIILGGLLLITVIGAFQLKNDDKFKDKDFLALMKIAYRQIPFLGKFLPQKNKE